QGAGPHVHAPPVGAQIHRHTYESDLHRGVSLAVFSLQEYPGTPRRLTCAPRSLNIVQGAASRARILQGHASGAGTPLILTGRARLVATPAVVSTARLCVPPLAGAPAAHAQHASAEGIAYEIIVPFDRERRRDVRLTIFPEAGFAGGPVELRL